MDGSTAVGGVNAAPRPMEVLLMSLAGCSSIDVVSILKNKDNRSWISRLK